MVKDVSIIITIQNNSKAKDFHLVNFEQAFFMCDMPLDLLMNFSVYFLGATHASALINMKQKIIVKN